MKADELIIDAHAMLGHENHLALTSAELLARMQANGIATALARPMGAGLVVENRAGNDAVLKGDKRIRGWCTANPWFGQKALEEIKRCQELNAVGLFLHPSRQGFMPIESQVDPLLNLAAQLRWPVMFHTGTYIQADILAVAEVARRYPDTQFIAGFGGFTDMWFELPGVFGEVENLILDTSMIWGAAVLEIVEKYGASRVMYGSAEPRNRYPVGLKLLKQLEFPDPDLKLILHGNANRIFQWT